MAILPDGLLSPLALVMVWFYQRCSVFGNYTGLNSYEMERKFYYTGLDSKGKHFLKNKVWGVVVGVSLRNQRSGT